MPPRGGVPARAPADEGRQDRFPRPGARGAGGSMSRLIAFASRTVGLFILLAAGWFAFLFASGDQLVECDYADCGTIGEFANAHTVQLLWAFLAVSLAVPGALLLRRR